MNFWRILIVLAAVIGFSFTGGIFWADGWPAYSRSGLIINPTPLNLQQALESFGIIQMPTTQGDLKSAIFVHLVPDVGSNEMDLDQARLIGYLIRDVRKLWGAKRKKIIIEESSILTDKQTGKKYRTITVRPATN